MNNSSKTPVALLIFNRPEATRRVFDSIRAAKPPILLVVADGPRDAEEKIKCDEARKIIDEVDWDCEVLKNYSVTNLGCKKRVSSGLTWVFNEVDRAIILEDDCLPHPTFFAYCDQLLEKYKDDDRIMHVSGDNFHQNNPKFRCTESYYFSNIPHIWGWASWRRAWRHYDVNISTWPDIKKKNVLLDIFRDDATADRWEDKFDQYYARRINSWDGQWAYACITNRGLCIMPKVNLISNIGFGKGATHTSADASTHELAALPTIPMQFPLIHPKEFKVDEAAAGYISDLIFGVYRYRSMRHKVRRIFKKLFPRLYHKLKSRRNSTSVPRQ